ncbi:MAG: hypothetical protein ACR2PH_08375, partial [Desulfobulbia bacterium]
TRMKTGLYLLFVVASLPRWIEAAELDLSGSDSYPPSDYKTVDRVQRGISESINSAAQWIDSFFDDDRFIAEDATTKVRLSESVFLEHGDSPEFKTKVSLSIKIPKTKRRLRVFVASEDDTNKTPDALFNRVEDSEETSAAGVQYFAKTSKKRNLSLTTGIKLDSTEFFIGPRYRRTFRFDSWQLRFTQRVRWLSRKGWEATTRFDYERLLGEKLFFRHTVEGRWRDEDEGYQYEIRPSLIQQLRSKKPIEYRWNNLFKTSPNHRLDSSVLLIRYRRNFKRKWLFYEINPQIALRNDEDFEPKAGITFQIEVVFGGKDFLKRRDNKPLGTSRLEAIDKLPLPGFDQNYQVMSGPKTAVSHKDTASWIPVAGER